MDIGSCTMYTHHTDSSPPFPFSVRRKEIAGTWLESISGTSTRVIFPQQNDHVGVSQNVLFDRSRKRTVFN